MSEAKKDTEQDTSRFDKLPEKIRERLIEITTNPSPIKLNADGTLNIDEGVLISTQIDNLSKLVPQPPNLESIKSEEERKEIRTIFEVEVIRKVLDYTEEFIDEKIKEGQSYEKIKQDLTELGRDVELILSATSRKFTVQQISEQQWGKYSLRYEEVIKLESVASLRREINVRRANWEKSEEYLTESRKEIAAKDEQFKAELSKVTDTLWKILHIGANYLTAKERLKIKMSTGDFTKKERISYVESQLVKLRISYLKRWRIEGDKFELPKPKS